MNLTSLLSERFGFSAFRPNQEAVCEAAAKGKDVLLVMPTGAGKSLCYQLPALARGGTALVVSPLIALMDDQAAKLSKAGLAVARIHSGLSREDSRQACRDYLDGRLHFLFIAPERMRVPGFPEMLARRKPSLIAIDEAHCISAWGHDFRPDYRTLGDYLPALRPAPIVALTATATPTVQRDIVAQLGLAGPSLFIHGFRRDNLGIEVLEMPKPRRTAFIKEFLQRTGSRPAIVYSPSRKAAEEIAGVLGGRAAAYHAGLDGATRERVQRHFLAGELDVVVATIAFGMGIDKADVRTVIHAALPASVESFYQEIGRAGRDGLPSRTVLLHSFADRKMHDFFLERDYPASAELDRLSSLLTQEFQEAGSLARRLKLDVDSILRSAEKLAGQGAAAIDMDGRIRSTGATGWRSGYDAQIAFRRAQIDRIAAFAEGQGCRMTALVRHFGDTEDGTKPCGRCDVCAPGHASAQPFREANPQEQKILRSILRELGGNGRSTGKLFAEVAPNLDRKVFDGLLDGLARAGFLTLTPDTFLTADGRQVSYKKAALTHEGRHVEAGDLPVLVRAEAEQDASGRSAKSRSRQRDPEASEQPLSAEQTLVADRLRAWRTLEAAKTGKPAFLVLTDKTLIALAGASPSTLGSMGQVPGIGPDKLERYGADILQVIQGEAVSLQVSFVANPPSGLPRAADASTRVSLPVLDMTREQAPREQAPKVEPSLTAEQQALESRLRTWRQTASEKLGMPQFFVLGSTSLRDLAIIQPQSTQQLHSIRGLSVEKIERFGVEILELCRG